MLTSSLFRILGRDTGCVEYMSLRVRLDTAYFAENNNKKNCWLLFILKKVFICLMHCSCPMNSAPGAGPKKKRG